LIEALDLDRLRPAATLPHFVKGPNGASLGDMDAVDGPASRVFR
jgi:hypothetical protein